MDHYIIRVGGHLSDEAMAGFEGVHVSREPVQTLIQGDLPDQTALAGLLDYLDELGVVIVDVVKVPQ